MLGTGDDGWTKYQFFVFLATTMFINSAVQMFFMPNAEPLLFIDHNQAEFGQFHVV